MDKIFNRKTVFFFIYLSTSLIFFKRYIDAELNEKKQIHVAIFKYTTVGDSA